MPHLPTIHTRPAVCHWPGGHTHPETLPLRSPAPEDVPRVLRIGYAPHYAFFILTHLENGTAHYRLSSSTHHGPLHQSHENAEGPTVPQLAQIQRVPARGPHPSKV